MLHTVLNSMQPENWVRSSYEGTTYELYTVHSHTSEYDKVVAPFDGLTVSKVNRVQNPYILGRFKIREEQILNTEIFMQEMQMYHPIHSSNVEMVAEYNCDYRRGTQVGCSAQHINKKAIFFQTPTQARQHFARHASASGICIVAVRVINGENTSYVTKDCDTEYCPEYFVFLEN